MYKCTYVTIINDYTNVTIANAACISSTTVTSAFSLLHIKQHLLLLQVDGSHYISPIFSLTVSSVLYANVFCWLDLATLNKLYLYPSITTASHAVTATWVYINNVTVLVR